MDWIAIVAGGLAAALLLCCRLLWRRWRAAERRARHLIDQLPQAAVFVFDRNLRVRFAAGAALAELRRDAASVEGRRIDELLPLAQAEEIGDHVRAALRGEARAMLFRALAVGRDYWLRIVPLVEGDGERIERVVAMALDVTQRGELGLELGADARRIDAVGEVTRALARSTDPVAARTAICAGVRAVAEADVVALLEPGPGALELVPTAVAGAELEGVAVPLDDATAGAARAFEHGEEVLLSRRDGPEADRELLAAAGLETALWVPVIRDQAPIGLLAIGWRRATVGISPRTAALVNVLAGQAAIAIGRAEIVGRLEQQARTDMLTGLPNRRSWEEHLPRELARAEREGQPLCVAMLDLDHFKQYNDRRGHQAGDRLLKQAAGAWRARLRRYDVLARYGGEEFSVVLPSCTADRARMLAERLRAATPEGESCSVGIAEWDRSEPPEALVGRADVALYTAKRTGRDRVVVAPPQPGPPPQPWIESRRDPGADR